MRSENFPVGSPAPRGGKSRAQGHDISANEIQIAESGNTASSQQLCGASADPGGVPKFKDIGRAMATRSASLLMEEDGLGSALSQALQSCPEVLSTIYTAHHRRVLQVCRRFFRHPEDAEDAAAEVFLKLHRVLEKETRRRPSRLGSRRWQAGIALISCVAESGRRIRALQEPTLAKSPTIRLLRHSPRFCVGKNIAR